jgi:hypothetical protein
MPFYKKILIQSKTKTRFVRSTDKHIYQIVDIIQVGLIISLYKLSDYFIEFFVSLKDSIPCSFFLSIGKITI